MRKPKSAGRLLTAIAAAGMTGCAQMTPLTWTLPDPVGDNDMHGRRDFSESVGAWYVIWADHNDTELRIINDEGDDDVVYFGQGLLPGKKVQGCVKSTPNDQTYMFSVTYQFNTEFKPVSCEPINQ